MVLKDNLVVYLIVYLKEYVMDYLICYWHQTGAVLQTLDNGLSGLYYYPPNGDNVSSGVDKGFGICGEGLLSPVQKEKGIKFGARACAVLQTIIGKDCKPQLCGIVERCLLYIIC